MSLLVTYICRQLLLLHRIYLSNAFMYIKCSSTIPSYYLQTAAAINKIYKYTLNSLCVCVCVGNITGVNSGLYYSCVRIFSNEFLLRVCAVSYVFNHNTVYQLYTVLLRVSLTNNFTGNK